MIVCHCRVVTDREVADAVAAAPRSLGRCAARPGPARTAARASSRSSGWCASMGRAGPAPPVPPVGGRRCSQLVPAWSSCSTQALTFELTVTNTYFLHARMLDNWGLGRLGKVFYDLSIDEMKDADALINRILMFEGHPNVQRLGSITVGETAEEMLPLAHESEKAAVAQFNAAAQECHDARRPRHGRGLRGDGPRRGDARRVVREPARRDQAGRRPAVPRPDGRHRPAGLAPGVVSGAVDVGHHPVRAGTSPAAARRGAGGGSSASS